MFRCKGEPFGNLVAVSRAISSVQREERISQVWLREKASPYATKMVLIRTRWKSQRDTDHNLLTDECDLLSAAAVQSNRSHNYSCTVVKYFIWIFVVHATLYVYSTTQAMLLMLQMNILYTEYIKTCCAVIDLTVKQHTVSSTLQPAILLHEFWYFKYNSSLHRLWLWLVQ